MTSGPSRQSPNGGVDRSVQAERWRRFWRAALLLGAVPVIASVVMYVEIDGAPATAPDTGVFVGLTTNLREHGSFTAPSDVVWLRLSPAETVERDGFLPVSDFAPLYPLTAAAWTDPIAGYLALGIAGLVGVLLAVGSLVHRATRSFATAIATQVFLVVGPVDGGEFGLAVPFLDLFSRILSDGFATAAMIGAIALWVRPVAGRGWVARIPAAILMAIACGTRYAFVGAAAGLVLAALIDRLRDRRDGENRGWWPALVAAASAVPALLWSVGYQAATDGPPAKAFLVHGTSMAPIGRAVAGWFGFDLGASAAGGYFALGLLVAGAVAAATLSASRVARTCAAAMLGYLGLHVATRLFLDAGFAFAAERTLLPIRVLLVVLIAAVAGQIRVGSLSVGRVTVRPALAVTGVIAVAVVAISGPQVMSDFGAAPVNYDDLRLEPDVWLVSDFPDGIYALTGIASVGLPQPIEPATGKARNVKQETDDLVDALRERTTTVTVLTNPLSFDRQNWPACAVASDDVGYDTYVTYVLDISAC